MVRTDTLKIKDMTNMFLEHDWMIKFKEKDKENNVFMVVQGKNHWKGKGESRER